MLFIEIEKRLRIREIASWNWKEIEKGKFIDLMICGKIRSTKISIKTIRKKSPGDEELLFQLFPSFKFLQKKKIQFL